MQFEDLKEHRARIDSRVMLVALQIKEAFHGGHIYAGTVPAPVVAKRRAKDKAARAARKVARRSK